MFHWTKISSISPTLIINRGLHLSAANNAGKNLSASRKSIKVNAKKWKQKSELPFQSELRNPVAAVYEGELNSLNVQAGN